MAIRSWAFILFASIRAAAQPSCPAGRLAPDFGYEFVSCVGCLSVTHVGALTYTRFLGEPVLHRIRADGPGAQKLLDQDTLITVGGHPVTTLEAAKLLADWQRDSVELVVRRGNERHVWIAATAVCVPTSPRRALRPTTSARVTLGIALECAGCRFERAKTGRGQWVYPSPPAVAEVMPNGAGWKAGILAGDTLLAIDGFSILSEEGGRLLAAIEPGRAMEWTLKRGGNTRVARIIPEESAAGRPRRRLP